MANLNNRSELSSTELNTILGINKTTEGENQMTNNNIVSKAFHLIKENNEVIQISVLGAESAYIMGHTIIAGNLIGSTIAAMPVILPAIGTLGVLGLCLSPFVGEAFPNTIASILNKTLGLKEDVSVSELEEIHNLFNEGVEYVAPSVEVSIPKIKALPRNHRSLNLKTTYAVNFENASGENLKEAFNNALNDKAFTFNSNFSKTFTKSVLAKTVISIDFEALTLTVANFVGKTNEVSSLVYNTRAYVLLTFDGKTEEERVCGVYDASVLLRVVAHLINNCSEFQLNRASKIVSELVSKVFVARPEQAILNINGRAYGNRNEAQFSGLELDQQNVYKAHKISGLSIQSLNNTFAIAATTFNGEEMTTVAKFFAELGQPVIADKNAKKYFVYGDGARSCGVDLVDGKIVTLNPISRNEDGVIHMVEKVQGFFGSSVMEVEVSTADENHGVSHLGLNEQAILSYASTRVNEGLQRAMAKSLAKADLLTGGHSIPSFNLNDNRASLVEFLKVSEGITNGTKAHMNALAQKAPLGIRIEWNHTKKDRNSHPWTAELPFGLLVAFGNWDDAGHPTASVVGTMAYKDDEETVTTSYCIASEVFDFINVITSETISDAEKVNLFVRSNLIANWVEDKRTAKVANKLTKAGLAFHQKVVGDLTIPNKLIDRHSFPVVRINSNNPMVKNGELDKLVKEGLAVRDAKGTIPSADAKVKHRFAFLSRCPLPLFTAVVVEFDDTLDSTVIAVNPLVWIKSNLGDFDGDLAYVTDASQFGFNNTIAAAKFNKNYSPLFVSKAGDAVIKDALAVRDRVINADKSVHEVVASWTEINNVIEVVELANVASNVHNHYKNSVGSLYRVAEALTQGLALENPEELNEAQVKALIEAWFLYEEVGLGGWTIKNQETVRELSAAVKLILNHGSLDALSTSNNQGNILDLIANVIFLGLPMMTEEQTVGMTNAERRRACASSQPVECPFDYQIVKAAAGIAVAKKIQAGKMNARGHEKAVVVQAISLISRKDIKENEIKVFTIANNVNIYKGRFNNAIKTIGALRAEVKPNK